MLLGFGAPYGRAMTRHPLTLAGVAAGPIFMVAVLIEGATRPGYDALRHPISSLALGPAGWTQTAVFLVCGMLAAAYAVHVRGALGGRRSRTVWLAMWGVSLIVAGLFTTDAVSGYPPGTPAYPAGTISGTVHNLAALCGLIGLTAACVSLRGLGGSQWQAYSIGTAVVLVGAFVIAAIGLGQTAGLVDVAGLFQRIAVYAGWTWLTLLAWRTGNATSTSPELASESES